MKQQGINLWKVEIIWYVLTLIVALIVLFPIYNKVPNYPFYLYNIVFVIVFVNFARYIFLWKYTPFAYSMVLKLIIIFTAIPILVLLIDGISEFQNQLDEEGYETFLGHLNPTQMTKMAKYIQAEYIFLGVSSVICAIIFPIRMIISIWRVRNRGTV